MMTEASVETSTKFSELKLVSENFIFCLCRSKLRSYHALIFVSAMEVPPSRGVDKFVSGGAWMLLSVHMQIFSLKIQCTA